MTAHIDLSDQTTSVLRTIAQETGKTPDDLIREAVEEYIRNFQQAHRGALLRQAQGMWKDRDDLPALTMLREELDRR
jgi:predicted transcriptional regulator